jgi:hypothetical protein
MLKDVLELFEGVGSARFLLDDLCNREVACAIVSHNVLLRTWSGPRLGDGMGA